ncbi:MAG: serine/threonine protein kinase [Fuerstiella sp.]|nr:serine/threonine protein kinase [Fuerstiella sp.]MCP4853950.1 serine/threonine protein kinase [Fuerstiella sp.]
MTASTETSGDDRDERLAEVLDRLINDSQSASSAGLLDKAVRENPDLESDIRGLYATAMIAADVALLQSDEVSRMIAGETPDEGPAPASTSPVGLMIGEYELREEIGRGGMGVVYRAYQQSLDRTVALKMIPNAAFAASHDLARLRAEAMAAARLSHPNIVPVYEVGEYDGQPWFSMQFVEGTTLSTRLADGPMTAEDAVRLLLPVVRAIDSAHQAGVLHRDLKPSNILIKKAGEPFVTDFGLAKRVPLADDSLVISGGSDEANLTQSGAILGTPSWMSPEQAAGQTDAIDVTSDIYSLGAILFAMLTGRPPFQAASPFDTLLMVMEQDPPAIRVLNSKVDVDLEMVVLKCLQKPRDLRYSSARELVEDLTAWLNREPVSARRSTIMNVMSRLFRESHHVTILRNWGLLWMLHSMVLLMLCLLTNACQFAGVTSRLPYVGLWVVGLGLWAAIFWNLRSRSGPITSIERQVAHVWGGSMVASSMLFAVESVMNEPVLKFSPVLGCIAGIVFLAKAGMLSGRFYIHAIAMFATSIVMAAIQRQGTPNFSITLFGVVSGLAFFLPGLKYYRQQKRA